MAEYGIGSGLTGKAAGNLFTLCDGCRVIFVAVGGRFPGRADSDGPQFTHVAFDDFRVVYDALTGGSRATTGRLVPYVMFTDPELTRVGLSETEARRRGIGYRLLTMLMEVVLRTHTLSERRGFLKMLIAADGDEILGFSAFGAEASEMMAAVQTAMVGHVPYTALQSAIYAHPTMAEGITYLLRTQPAEPAG